jgi:hypothetical protein
MDQILGVIAAALDTIAVQHGLGHHASDLTPSEITAATKFNFFAIPFNLMSSAIAKVSVCLFLIHININPHAGYVLYGVSIALPLLATATISVLFGQCTPASALWTRQGKCLSPSVNGTVGLVQSGTFHRRSAWMWH